MNNRNNTKKKLAALVFAGIAGVGTVVSLNRPYERISDAVYTGYKVEMNENILFFDTPGEEVPYRTFGDPSKLKIGKHYKMLNVGRWPRREVVCIKPLKD